jgi:hypothetical protein
MTDDLTLLDEQAHTIRELQAQIDRMRATIAALLAVPDDALEVPIGTVVYTNLTALRARMAAVVEGER